MSESDHEVEEDTSPLIMACIFWSESLSGLKQSYWKYLETRSFCDSYMSKIVAMSQYEPRQGPPEETSGPPSAVPCFEVRVWQLRNPWQVVPCLLHGRETMNNYIFQNTREPRTCSGVSHRIHLCFGSSPRFPRLIDHPVLFDRGLFLGSTLGLPAVSSSLTNPK